MKKYDINGKFKNWIKQFLTNRYQKAFVQGWSLNAKKVRSGIPQGSVIWPLLLIMLNEILEKLSCDIYFFTDGMDFFFFGNGILKLN